MKKKFIFISVVLLSTFIIGCSKNNTKENSLSIITDSTAETSEVNGTEFNKENYSEILLQRNNDCFRLQSNEISNQGIVFDVKNLLWIAVRGGAGITDTGVIKSDNELPVVVESNNFLNQNSPSYTTDKDYTWIRLVCDSYIPEEGENAIGHKDIIIYLSPDNESNAIFGIQDPEKLTQWTIINMPDYGSWLSKEIDILLRIQTGL